MKRILSSAALVAMCFVPSVSAESLIDGHKPKHAATMSVHPASPLSLNDLLGTSAGVQVYVSGTLSGIGDVSGMVDLKLVGVPVEALDDEDGPPNAKTIYLKVEQPSTAASVVPAVAGFVQRAEPAYAIKPIVLLDGVQFGLGVSLAMLLVIGIMLAVHELLPSKTRHRL